MLIRRESLAAFSPASGEHALTALAFHARPKAVIALAAASVRLIRAFHGCRLLVLWQQKMRRGAKATFDYKSHAGSASTALRFCKGSRYFFADRAGGSPKMYGFGLPNERASGGADGDILACHWTVDRR
jgi:hypothetical protein